MHNIGVDIDHARSQECVVVSYIHHAHNDESEQMHKDFDAAYA